MARPDKYPPDKNATDDSQSTDSAVPTATATRPSSRSQLLVAVVVASVWMLALAGLAVSTANQPMLNRTQVRQADWIVTGRVIDVEQGSVDIEKEWMAGRNGDAPKSIVVRDLSKSKARKGSRYLLPLTFVTGETWEITRPRLENGRRTDEEMKRPPRIYDVTDDAIRQLHEMLPE